MFQDRYIASCKCSLLKNELVYHRGYLICPKHYAKIIKTDKICQRCGERYFINSIRCAAKKYCDTCSKEIDLARTIYKNHNFKTFTDPILWKKPIKEIINDCGINLLMGYDAINIATPRKVQHDKKMTKINPESNLNILKKQKLKMKNKKDCRTCSKINSCTRNQECLQYNFKYWSKKK